MEQSPTVARGVYRVLEQYENGCLTAREANNKMLLRIYRSMCSEEQWSFESESVLSRCLVMDDEWEVELDA